MMMRQYILMLFTVPLLLVSCDGFKILEEQAYEIARNGYPIFVNDDFEQHDGRFSTRNRYETDRSVLLTDMISHSGDYSVLLGDHSTGAFETTVDVPYPSVFSFRGIPVAYFYQYSDIDDYIEVRIDSVEVSLEYDKSADGEWGLFRFDVPAGVHTIRFESPIYDTGFYIDDIAGYGLLQSPSFDELVPDGLPLLEWNEGSSSGSYHLQISDDPDFSAIVLDIPELRGTEYQVTSPLEGNTRYYWRIKGTSDTPGRDRWCTPWSFRVPGHFEGDGFESGDFSGSIWLASGDSLPVVSTDAAYDGRYGIALGQDFETGTSSVSNTFIAADASCLSFQLGLTGSQGTVRLYLDDEEVYFRRDNSYSSTIKWQKSAIVCGPGQHTVRWEIEKYYDQDSPVYLDCIELSSIQPFRGDDFETGSFAGNDWAVTGAVLPVVQNGTTHNSSGYAVWFADPGDYNESSLMVAVDLDTAAKISFSCMRERYYDDFNFYLDGQKTRLSTSYNTWRDYSWDLPAGPHLLKWTYYSDDTLSNNFYLDDIVIE